MLYVGITGHQDTGDPASQEWIRDRIARVLRAIDSEVIGVSSLAAGADQLFADELIACGGRLFVIVPFPNYEKTFRSEADLANYYRLSAEAIETTVLESQGTDEESYLAAGKHVVQRSDVMLAVWNGKPATGIGGTGDIVCYATSKAKHVVHINPSMRIVTVICPLDLDTPPVNGLLFRYLRDVQNDGS